MGLSALREGPIVGRRLKGERREREEGRGTQGRKKAWREGRKDVIERLLSKHMNVHRVGGDCTL